MSIRINPRLQTELGLIQTQFPRSGSVRMNLRSGWFGFIRIHLLVFNRFALNEIQNVSQLGLQRDFGIALIGSDWIPIRSFRQGTLRKMDIKNKYLDIQLWDSHIIFSVVISGYLMPWINRTMWLNYTFIRSCKIIFLTYKVSFWKFWKRNLTEVLYRFLLYFSNFQEDK